MISNHRKRKSLPNSKETPNIEYIKQEKGKDKFLTENAKKS